MKRAIVAVCGVALLGGCGGGGDDSRQAIVSACEANESIRSSYCDCVADKAVSELSADGLAFVIAALNEDREGAQAARARLDPEEAATAASFMTRGPVACASEIDGY